MIEDVTYEFPLFERAPPEGYMTQDYVAYVKPAVAFSS